MAIPPEEVPSLMDLQVLSPLAWIRREATRLQRINGDPNYEPHAYFSVISDRVSRVDSLVGGTLMQRPTDEEDRRRLEYGLIQIAAHAVLWLEDLRRNDYAPKNTPEPTNG